MFRQSADLYDAFYAWKDYERESQLMRGAIEQHRKSAGGSLLDVACGTGLHLQHLKRWFVCEGCDLDPEMLRLAGARNPDLKLFSADMSTLATGRTYDAVVCLFSSIGYVSDPLLAIGAMARHLAPGGVLAVEPWLTPQQVEPGRPHALFVDREHLKACRMSILSVDGRRSRLDFQYLVGRGNRVEHFTETHDLWLHTDAEYRRAFAEAGLNVELDPEGPTGRGLYIGTTANWSPAG